MSGFPRLRSSRKYAFLKDIRIKNVSNLLPRVLLACCVVAALASMYLTSTIKVAGLMEYSLPELNVGDITSKLEIAIIDFQVPKSPEQLAEERRQASADIIPVFNFDREPASIVLMELDSLFSVAGWLPTKSIPDSIKKIAEEVVSGTLTFNEIDSFRKNLVYRRKSHADTAHIVLTESLDLIYEMLIVSRKDDLRYYSEDFLMLENDGEQRKTDVGDISDVSDAGDSLRANLRIRIGKLLPARNLKAVSDIASRLIIPNVSYNAPRTGELRRQAMDAVPLSQGSYKKNERIIEGNVPVTASQLAALKAYQNELESQTFEENRRKHYAMAAGKIIVALGLIGMIIGYLYLNRPRIYSSFPHLLLLTIISALPLSVAYYTTWGGAVSEFLVPVAVATILSTVLFDAEIGIMMSLCVSLLVASLVPESGLRLGLLYFLAGSVGVLTVGRVRHRKEFYRSMFFVPVTMAIAVVATNDWLFENSFASLGKDVFVASINGFLCPIIAIGLLPLLESVFKIATDITLLELSDLNNPLLKDLAVKAPGTFSSVLIVGALAETAAEQINANSLLARVGSYYHDIGKSVIPEYFIENQYGGVNPHDRLTPHMSALVIASHVKEGYELGNIYGLPETILDIIKQHHGTSLMASIYHKAKEQSGDDNVEESAFRYPGPKPQTREAGIVMLADLVEAASRSVHEKNPGRLKTLITTIIQKRFMDGELNECDLTLKDLHNIETSFLPVLVGSHHGRIQYPWQKEAKDNNAVQQNGDEITDNSKKKENGKEQKTGHQRI